MARINRKIYDRARRRLGLTHKAIAGALGINPVTVQKWAGGTASPSVDHLAALAKLLKVKMEALIK